MGKVRVHELAREMGLNSKEMIAQLEKIGIKVKNHFSTLEEEEVRRIKSLISTPSSKGRIEGAPSPVPTVAPIEQQVEKQVEAQTEQQLRQLTEKSIPQATKEGSRGVEEKKKTETPSGRPFPSGREATATGGIKEEKFRPREGAERAIVPGPRGEQFAGKKKFPPRPVQGASQPERQPYRGERPAARPGDRLVSTPPGAKSIPPPVGKPGFPRAGEEKNIPRVVDVAVDKTIKPKEKGTKAMGDKKGERMGSRVANKGMPKKVAEIGVRPGGKITYFHDFDDERIEKLKIGRKKTRPGGRDAKGEAMRPPAPTLPQAVTIGKSVTVQELAGVLNITPVELVKKLMEIGVMAAVNQEIDFDTAAIVCTELGVTVHPEVSTEEALMPEIVDDPATMEERPPVVTVMGHVDHGKTSLLDAIRRTRVTETEAGGITQHIGAYQVEVKGKKITFIDTPGHEAFTAMRARGAQVTDIAILVVAADDGVMPQTVEAINHARAAQVPIIVAINKIDKPNANPDRVKQQLVEYGLIAEDWGGDTICVPVSAHTKEGLDTLLEMILLMAEMMEIKANYNRPAKGTVIEAQLDKGRGPVATVLVQHGTLRVGDYFLVGLTYGRVRAMLDDKGQWLKEATPSTPVAVLGLNEVPMAGDIFQVVPDERTARQIIESRHNRKRIEEQQKTARVTLEDLFKQIQEGKVKELKLIIKADVQGSIEALKQSLEKQSTDEVRVDIIHTGVGAITENDIMLAAASNAIVIGFNVRPDSQVRKIAEQEKVDIRLYRVIYEAIEDIRHAMSGLLEPDIREVVLGRAEVRATFKVPKVGVVAGCYVLEGKMVKGAGVRVIRDGIVIHEGRIESLKRFKDDVREVLQGFECGLGVEKFNDVKEGDVLEAFTTEKVERVL